MSRLVRLAIGLGSGLILVAAVMLLLSLGPNVVLAEDQPDGSTITTVQTVDGTWGPGVITATSDVTISAGVVITIAPNTTVMVADGVEIIVLGDLHSDGPVLFTAVSEAPGSWKGLTYASDTGCDSTGYLEQATVEYAHHALTLDTNAPITISDSILRYNKHEVAGTAYGAGLYIVKGDHLVQNTHIYSNTAKATGSGQVLGGGIYIVDGAPHILDSWIYENTATSTVNVGGAGGGIAVVGGAPLIENSHIMSNTLGGRAPNVNSAVRSGGGIGFYGSTDAVIRGCWIAANRNELAAGYSGGGGIGFGENGTAALIDRNVIYANYIQASGWCEGAGIDTWDETNVVTITNNLIISNTSGACLSGYGAFGGGINMNAAAAGVYFINNTVVGNQAGQGGGIYMQAGNVVALNNVVVSNTATIANKTGGIHRTAGTADYNDIWGNTAPQTAGTMGTHNLAVDPMFLGTGDLVQQYHLSRLSTLIDAGTHSGTGIPGDDYDGDLRPMSAGWDIGFDEVVPVLTIDKRVAPTTVEAGDLLTYTVVVENTGEGTATDLAVSDPLPAHTAYVPGSSQVTLLTTVPGGTPPTLTSGITLSAGQKMTVTYLVTVSQPLAVGTLIENTASVTSTQTPDPLSDSASSTVINSAPVVEDQIFSVDENSSDGTSVGTVVASDINAGDLLTYTIISGNTDAAFGIDASTGELTVSDGSKLDYETTSLYTLTVEVTDLGLLTDTADIVIGVNNVDYAPVLDMVKDGPATVDVDQLVTYTFTISHAVSSDGSAVKNVVVTDTLAGTALYVAGDTNGDAMLAGDETWVYTATYKVKATDVSPLVNTGRVAGQDLDGTPVGTSALHSAEILRYTVDVNVVGQGTVSKDPDQADYYYGQMVTLTATSDPGWSFTEWSGDASGTSAITMVTVDGTQVVTATFTDVPASLAVSAAALPTTLVEPGGAVTFTVHVDNTSAADTLTLTGLTSDIHGDLDGKGTCTVPHAILVGGTYDCSFTADVSGVSGDVKTFIFSATGEDEDSNPVNGQDDATVTILPRVPAIGDYMVYLPLVQREQ